MFEFSIDVSRCGPTCACVFFLNRALDTNTRSGCFFFIRSGAENQLWRINVRAAEITSTPGAATSNHVHADVTRGHFGTVCQSTAARPQRNSCDGRPGNYRSRCPCIRPEVFPSAQITCVQFLTALYHNNKPHEVSKASFYSQFNRWIAFFCFVFQDRGHVKYHSKYLKPACMLMSNLQTLYLWNDVLFSADVIWGLNNVAK